MQDEVVIKKNRSILKFWVVALTMIVIWWISLLITKYRAGGSEEMWEQLAGAVSLLVLLLYYVKELSIRKVVIAISYKGIYLRKKGLYPWKIIDSFSTADSYEPYIEKLVLHFVEYADEDIETTHLEKNKEEIVDLILAYKGSSNLYYAGHNVS